MWHSAELWCLPASVMRRWYLAARVGSMRRAWPAAMNRACRRTASPRLVGPPCRSFTPEASRSGTRPVKARAPAREVNRFGSPSRARMAAAVMVATPGAEVTIPVGSVSRSSSVVRSSRSLISSVSCSASRASRAMSSARWGIPAHRRTTTGGFLGLRRVRRRRAARPRRRGVPVAEPGQPGPAEPLHHVRIGIAGGEELQRRPVGQIAADHGVPGRAEDLQQGIQSGQALAAAGVAGGLHHHQTFANRDLRAVRRGRQVPNRVASLRQKAPHTNMINRQGVASRCDR
jgi:hypothetical protein